MLHFSQDRCSNAARMTKLPASRRRLVKTDAGVLDVLDIGSGQTHAIILITHGLGSLESFQEVAEGLETRFPGKRIIAYSRPGRGRSEGPNRLEPADYLSFEACLTIPAIMRALGLVSADFVAHSDGAAVAMLFACMTPWMVNRIVAIAPQVCADPQYVASTAALRAAQNLPEALERLGATHLDPALAVHYWTMARLALCANPDYVLDRLQKLNAPLLLIQGLKDDLGAPQQMSAISARVPGQMNWVILRQDGHYPQHDSTDVVLDMISGHLKQPDANVRTERLLAHAAI